MKKLSKNIQTVIAILKDEVQGDVHSALRKMTKDYSMTWMYAKGKKIFPSTSGNLESELEEVYPIKGRQYNIKNIAEGNNVVMVELVESYPNPKTKKIYMTPLVLVLEMKDHKIRTGRHYLDPKLSGQYLKQSDIGKAYKKRNNRSFIIK